MGDHSLGVEASLSPTVPFQLYTYKCIDVCLSAQNLQPGSPGSSACGLEVLPSSVLGSFCLPADNIKPGTISECPRGGEKYALISWSKGRNKRTLLLYLKRDGTNEQADSESTESQMDKKSAMYRLVGGNE